MLIKILQDIADNCIKTYNDGVDSENPSDYKKVSSSESSNQYNLISMILIKSVMGLEVGSLHSRKGLMKVGQKKN